MLGKLLIPCCWCLPSSDGYLVNGKCVWMAQAACILVWCVVAFFQGRCDRWWCVSYTREGNGPLNMAQIYHTLNYVPLPFLQMSSVWFQNIFEFPMPSSLWSTDCILVLFEFKINSQVSHFFMPLTSQVVTIFSNIFISSCSLDIRSVNAVFVFHYAGFLWPTVEFDKGLSQLGCWQFKQQLSIHFALLFFSAFVSVGFWMLYIVFVKVYHNCGQIINYSSTSNQLFFSLNMLKVLCTNFLHTVSSCRYVLF